MTLQAVLDATWPAAALHRAGPWLLREGRGGGKRVSAATAEDGWAEADIPFAEAEQARLGQKPLFMIREGEDRLDAALAARGYRVADPVVAWAAPVAALAGEVPPVTAFCIWPMLEIMRDLWEEGGIGPGRLAVMGRAAAPKTAVLGRIDDRAGGAAFVALHGDTAMLHALHIAPELRRRNLARYMMRAAAKWAQDHGAARFSVVVTRGNPPANALYASLGMEIVGQYHYRTK